MTGSGGVFAKPRKGWSRYRWLAGAGIVVVAPLLAVSLLQPHFDGLYGQDSYAYYDYAVGPLRASIQDAGAPPDFFWPAGYPLLVALLTYLTGRDPAAGQYVSLLSALLVVAFTALLATELLRTDAPGSRPGWRGASLKVVVVVSALLVAFNPQLWQSSIVVMSDTTALAAATLGAWLLARYANRPGSGWWLAAAAAATAFAAATRWAYALLAVPLAIYALVLLFHGDRRTALRHAAFAAVSTVVVFGALSYSALEDVAEGKEVGEVAFAGDIETYSWNPANALKREFDTADGHLSYSLPNGLYYLLLPAHYFFLTPVIAALLPLGVVLVLRAKRMGPIALLCLWPLAIFGFHAGAPWQNFRFGLAYLPPMAILAATGFAWLHARASSRGRMALAGSLAAVLVGMAFGGAVLSNRFIQRKDGDLATVRWVEDRTPDRARLITFGLTSTFRRYSEIETFEIYHLDPQSMDEVLASGTATYLLLEIPSIENQWADRAPGMNYQWLRLNRKLREDGTHRGYTLFQVETPEPRTANPARDVR